MEGRGLKLCIHADSLIGISFCPFPRGGEMVEFGGNQITTKSGSRDPGYRWREEDPLVPAVRYPAMHVI